MTNISLCSGAGTLDLAVEQITGNKTFVYAENDPFAARVMEARFPWATNLGDITKADWAGVAQQYQIDSLSAGFPCRNISNAGRRDGINGQWSKVWKNVAEAVRVVRPRLVFLENVAAIRSKDRGLDVVLADLAAVGYDARWTCLRAGDPSVGAPHRRDRWFCVAHPADADPERSGRYRWPRNFPEAGGGDELANAGHAAAGTSGDLRLLPTPKASDGPNGGPNQRDAAGNYYLPGVAVRLDANWVSVDGVDFGPAIHRWERVLGRPAPCPTEPGRLGKRRLASAFVEWMQGDDAGWITDLDIPRAQQIKIAGNQAITRQAVEGYRRLLTADLEAMAA